MGYVKTPAELADIQAQLAAATYEIDAVNVWFTTTEDFLRERCFPHASTCRASQPESSRSVPPGSVRSQFGSATIYVGARFGDIEGFYDLTMLLTGDMTVTLGRELWGESKKRGEIGFTVDESKVHGFAERNGVRLIEVKADIGPDLGPYEDELTSLHLKAVPNGNVTDLVHDPIVYVGKAYSHYRTPSGHRHDRLAEQSRGPMRNCANRFRPQGSLRAAIRRLHNG